LSYEDHDGDGRFETRSYFQHGRLDRREKDSTGDGTPDQVVYFDEKGAEQKAELDTNHDGKMDRWQYYRDGRPELIEADQDCDGRVDLRSRYNPDGDVSIIEEDRDRDGTFELVQQYDSRGWERIVVNDPGRQGCPVVTLYYRGDFLAQKEVDLDRDGEPDVRDLFRNDGTLRERCEFSSDGRRLGGPCPMRFFYVPTGDMVIQAERDCDGDGRPDEWYYYTDGKLSRIEEDRDRDGKADVWNHYDGDERPVRRERDFDGDGRPDLVE
jgi:hypothetical protein